MDKSNEQNYTNLKGYFKYFSDSLIDNIFVDKTLRFSQPWVLNDPLELNPIIKLNDKNEYDKYEIDGIIMPSINEWFRIQLIEGQINDFGILSLTKNPVSFTMWNNYGNGHKGFLLEFKHDFNENINFKSYLNEVYPIKKVNYVDQFIINIPEVSDKSGKFTNADFNEKCFYNKTKKWKYEKEFRLVRNLKDLGKPSRTKGSYREDNLYLGKLPFEIIDSVTFGAHMSIDNKKKIIENLKEYNINLLQAFVYKDEVDSFGDYGKVELLLLDTNDLMNNVLEILPQSYSIEREAYKKRKTIRLNKIENLPYFKNYEELVIDMYKSIKKRRNNAI